MEERKNDLMYTRAESINLETGEFPMTLATEGEATDGHILSIRGGQLPESLPLQISHVNDPQATLGSIRGFEKELRASPARLRAIGHIELSGPNAEARQDLAHMIDKGHVNRVSIRWDGIKATERTALPKDHPAHVAKDDANWVKRSGLFFEEWRALEGSLVAIPADAEAVIGRAAVSDDPMWRALLNDCVSIPDLIRSMDRMRSEFRHEIEAIHEGLFDLARVREPESDPEAPNSEVVEGEPVDIAGVLKDVLGDLTTGLRTEVRKELDAALGRVS